MLALNDVVRTIRNDVVDFAKDCDSGVEVYLGNDVDEKFPIYINLSDFPSHMTIRAEENHSLAYVYVERMLRVLSEFHTLENLDIWFANSLTVIEVPHSIKNVTVANGLEELVELLDHRTQKVLFTEGRKDLYYYNRFSGSVKLNRKLFVFMCPTLKEQSILANHISSLVSVGIHVIVCGTGKLYGPLFSKIYASLDLSDTSRGVLRMAGESTEFVY